MNCPACGAQGAIPWQKMGRMHLCRRCARSFRVDTHGGLVEVVRDGDNGWIDRTLHEKRRRRNRTVRFVTRFVVPLVGLAVVGFFIMRLTLLQRPPAEPEWPRELQPRVELFARSWVKKDWAVLRRLVTPGEDRNLYRWYTAHPAPRGTGAEPEVKVTVLTTTADRALVRVQVRGVGSGPLDLRQTWEERGDTWFFVVPPR
jgi:hypothetical protein